MTIRRAKGTGSVQKKGNSYYFRIKINGKEVCRKMKNVFTEEEAELEATRLYTVASAKTQEEIVLFAGRAREIIKKENSIPLYKAFDVYRKSTIRPATKEKTLKQHEYHWKLFLNWLPDNSRNIEDVENSMDSFFGEMTTQKNPRSFNCILKSLRLIFRVVYPHQPNPCKFIQKREEKTRHHEALNEKEIAKVLAAIDKDYPLSVPHRDEMKTLFRLGTYTGMRLKDCCLLKWKSIDLTNGYMKVKPYKTASAGRRVTIPVHADLHECLKDSPSVNEYVLPLVADRYKRNPTGVDLSANRIIWYAVGKKPPEGQLPERIKGYGFHSLRHSFVSFCANAGVPLAVVQEIVGHGSMIVTRVYTHFAPDTLRAAVDAVPGKRKKKTSTDKQRMEKIKSLLDGKKELTEIEKEILSLIK